MASLSPAYTYRAEGLGGSSSSSARRSRGGSSELVSPARKLQSLTPGTPVSHAQSGPMSPCHRYQVHSCVGQHGGGENPPARAAPRVAVASRPRSAGECGSGGRRGGRRPSAPSLIAASLGVPPGPTAVPLGERLQQRWRKTQSQERLRAATQPSLRPLQSPSTPTDDQAASAAFAGPLPASVELPSSSSFSPWVSPIGADDAFVEPQASPWRPLSPSGGSPRPTTPRCLLGRGNSSSPRLGPGPEPVVEYLAQSSSSASRSRCSGPPLSPSRSVGSCQLWGVAGCVVGAGLGTGGAPHSPRAPVSRESWASSLRFNCGRGEKALDCGLDPALKISLANAPRLAGRTASSAREGAQLVTLGGGGSSQSPRKVFAEVGDSAQFVGSVAAAGQRPPPPSVVSCQ